MIRSALLAAILLLPAANGHGLLRRNMDAARKLNECTVDVCDPVEGCVTAPVCKKSRCNLVVNGSFEDGADFEDPWVTLYPGDKSIDKWTVAGANDASIDLKISYWDASDGVRSIDLNGFNRGIVEQNVSVSSGLHTVFFDVSGRVNVDMCTFSIACFPAADTTSFFRIHRCQPIRMTLMTSERL